MKNFMTKSVFSATISNKNQSFKSRNQCRMFSHSARQHIRSQAYYWLCLLPIHQPQTKVTNNVWLLTDILCGFRLSRIIRFFIIRALCMTCTQTWAKQSIKARQWNPQTSLCASRQFSTLLRSGNCGRNGLQLKTVFNYFSFRSSDPPANSSASVGH